MEKSNRYQPYRSILNDEGCYSSFFKKRRRFDYQYRLPGWHSLYTGYACILFIQSRSDYVNSASCHGLRTIQNTLQCDLPGSYQDRDAGTIYDADGKSLKNRF